MLAFFHKKRRTLTVRGAFLGTLFFCSLTHCASQAQKRNYNIFFLGIPVGNMSIEKKTEGSMEMYELRSHAEADFLVGRRINDVEMRTIFKNDLMISAFSRISENGKVESFASTSWDGSQYWVHTDRGKFTVNEPATYSVISFYFKEPPPGTHKIFSEQIGQFVPLEKIGSNTYRYRLPNGDLNIYTYRNGKLGEVTMKRTFGTAHIRPAN